VFDKSARISAKKKGCISSRRGAKLSETTRAKISAARKGKPTTLGRRFTIEQKRKMSKARLSFIRNNPEAWSAIMRKTRAAAMMRKLPSYEKAARDHTRRIAKQLLRRVLRGKRKNTKTETALGYTKKQLREHLEAQFRPGMSWENRCSFHIDHKVPVAHFMRNGIFDQKEINALSNLQILTPQENRAKSDSFTENPRHAILTIDHDGTRTGLA
jgi:hypothetical protein